MLLLCIASGYYLLLWTNSLYDVLAVLPFKCFVNKQLLLLQLTSMTTTGQNFMFIPCKATEN